MHTHRRLSWLSAVLVILFLSSGCAVIEMYQAAGQYPTSTVLATPVVKNVPLATESVPASTLIPLRTLEPIPAQPSSGMGRNIFGAALESISSEAGLSLLADAGSAWTRRDFNWSLVEPEEGDRLWENVTSLEAEFLAADEKNMQVVLILGGSPTWAMDLNHPPCGGRIQQDKFGALANFARDMVARYSQPPFNVQYYELWNEPEVYSFLGCWGEPSDPLGYYGGYYYGEMLKLVYPAMKAANPEAQVMVGGLLLGCNPDLRRLNEDGSPQDCSMSDFFSGILASTQGNSFDGVSFHAYDYYGGSFGKYSNVNFDASWNSTGPVTLMKSMYLRDKLAEYGETDIFFMNTEAGLLCDGQTCLTSEFEATKAFYVVESYAAALADGYLANIWYSVFGGRGNGLITNDLTPLPAYYSFKFTQGILSGAQYINRSIVDNGVTTYEFDRNGQTIVILWSTDDVEHRLVMTINPKSIFRLGMDGNAVEEPATKDIVVGRAPLFIIVD